MTFEEFAQAQDALTQQLAKALQELTTEIQNIDNVPQSLQDKLAAAKALAQQLDDLTPDQPAPAPTPEPGPQS